jgi:hypothetical protein
MSNPAGRGTADRHRAGLLATGGYFVYSGITKRFKKNLSRLPSGEAGSAVTPSGRVGYIAKGSPSRFSVSCSSWRPSGTTRRSQRASTGP